MEKMMRILNILVIFTTLSLYIHKGNCGVTPTISITLLRPENGRTDTGEILISLKDDLIIECQIDNMPSDSMVQWNFMSQFSTTPKMISLNMNAFNPNKYKLGPGRRMNSYRLQVTSVEVRDSGDYQCLVDYAAQTDPIKDTATVLVGEKPIIQMSKSSTDKITKQGDTVEFTCFASGYPTPRITWKRGGGLTLPGGGESLESNVLRLENVQPSARGYYICEAMNDRGTATMRIQLYVRFRPIINVDKPVEHQKVGFKKGMTCYIQANPQPKQSAVKWSKDGVVINSNERHAISYNLASDNQVISSMMINGVHDSDYGSYTCLASNQEGQGSAQIKLDASDEPEPDGKTGQIRASSSAVSVSFMAVVVCLLLTLRINLQ